MGKSDRVKHRTRKSKRKFCGNQYTRAKSSTTTPTQTKKIEHIETDTPNINDPRVDGYRFIDLNLLTEFISALSCPFCFAQGLILKENFTKKCGFGSLLYLTCSCGYKNEFYTSPVAGRGYDVNRRIIYTMRNLGHGYGGIKKFTTFMDILPMTSKSFDRSVKTITNSVVKIAEESMSDAAGEIRSGRKENIDT